MCVHATFVCFRFLSLSLSLSLAFVVLSRSPRPFRPCTPPGFSAGKHIGTLSSPMCGLVTRAPVSPPRCPLHLALNLPSPSSRSGHPHRIHYLSLSLSHSLRPSTLHSEASNATVRTLHNVHIARCTVTIQPAVLKYTAH